MNKPAFRNALLGLVAGAGMAAAGGMIEDSKVVNFDKDVVGKLPEGWKTEGTVAKAATWEVQSDSSAPSGPNVLTVSKAAGDAASMNVCWSENVKFLSGTIELKLKSVSGKVEQGGGVVWRVKDANNYYALRTNPLTDTVKFFVVKDGRASEIATEKAEFSSGQWSTLKVEHRGDRITAWVGTKKLLEKKDATLADEGGVGFCTKGDAVTAFDDLKVEAVKAEAK